MVLVISRPPKRGQIVEVTWLDSTMRGRWDSEAEYLKWAKEVERWLI